MLELTPRRACAGGLRYLSCVCLSSLSVCLCLSVTTLAATSVVSMLKMRYVGVYLRFLIRGFSINPCVQKLWREKANMQISSYCSRPVLACFEYHAYISRYLQAAYF